MSHKILEYFTLPPWLSYNPLRIAFRRYQLRSGQVDVRFRSDGWAHGGQTGRVLPDLHETRTAQDWPSVIRTTGEKAEIIIYNYN